jgi:hypothetical protein
MRTTGKRLPVNEMRCRDEVYFDSRSSRKTYDANLGVNRIRVDDALRERQAFDEEQCTCKQLQHLQSFGRAS